jgi:hypothetical protein
MANWLSQDILRHLVHLSDGNYIMEMASTKTVHGIVHCI